MGMETVNIMFGTLRKDNFFCFGYGDRNSGETKNFLTHRITGPGGGPDIKNIMAFRR